MKYLFFMKFHWNFMKKKGTLKEITSLLSSREVGGLESFFGRIQPPAYKNKRSRGDSKFRKRDPFPLLQDPF
jgi:hypothetical protein